MKNTSIGLDKEATSDNLFGIMMLPHTENRYLIYDWLENLLHLIKLHGNVNNQIESSIKELTPELLKKRRFFKRFSKTQLADFVNKMTVQQYDKNEILYVES